MSTPPASSLPPKKRPVAAADDDADADAARADAANAAPSANADAQPQPKANEDNANKPRVTIDPLNLLGTHEPRDRFGDPLPPRPAKEPRLADSDSDAEDDSDADDEAAAADPPTTSAGIAAARRTGKIHGLVAEYRAPRIGAQYQATLPPLPSAPAPAAAPPPPPPKPADDA
jgi:hypothetical protein